MNTVGIFPNMPLINMFVSNNVLNAKLDLDKYKYLLPKSLQQKLILVSPKMQANVSANRAKKDFNINSKSLVNKIVRGSKIKKLTKNRNKSTYKHKYVSSKHLRNFRKKTQARNYMSSQNDLSDNLYEFEEKYKDILYDNAIKIGNAHQINLLNLKKGFKMFTGHIKNANDLLISTEPETELKPKQTTTATSNLLTASNNNKTSSSSVSVKIVSNNSPLIIEDKSISILGLSIKDQSPDFMTNQESLEGPTDNESILKKCLSMKETSITNKATSLVSTTEESFKNNFEIVIQNNSDQYHISESFCNKEKEIFKKKQSANKKLIFLNQSKNLDKILISKSIISSKEKNSREIKEKFNLYFRKRNRYSFQQSILSLNDVFKNQ